MPTAVDIYTAVRRFETAYASAMRPLAEQLSMAQPAVDILLFLANNPGPGHSPGHLHLPQTEAGHRVLSCGQAGAGGVSSAAGSAGRPAEMPTGADGEGRAGHRAGTGASGALFTAACPGIDCGGRGPL